MTHRRFRIPRLALLLTLASLGAWTLLTPLACTALQATADAPTPSDPMLTDDPTTRYVFADLADAVIPSVVTVLVTREVETAQANRQLMEQFDLFRRFFPFPDAPMPEPPGGPNNNNGDGGDEDEPETMRVPSTGSGVIISDDGYIVTNHHVIGEGPGDITITVILHDGREITGESVELVESNSLVDLALLKVQAEDLVPIRWGDSDALRMGERVAAVGSPWRLRGTVTQGIVCAKHRQVGPGLGDLIQTDAVINPGSSGGALVNLDGELIGINRLIASNSGAWQGYGFAIPSEDARGFVEDVIETGRYANGYIGVTIGGAIEDGSPMREALGLADDARGIVVIDVIEGRPADVAGMLPGDFILSVDDLPVANNTDLIGYVARQPIGSNVQVEMLRPDTDGDSSQRTVQIEIIERPSPEELRSTMQIDGLPDPPAEMTRSTAEDLVLGLYGQPFRAGDLQGLRVTWVEPDSEAARSGLQPGDLIVSFNGRTIGEMKDLAEAANAWPEGRPNWLYLVRQGYSGLALLVE